MNEFRGFLEGARAELCNLLQDHSLAALLVAYIVKPVDYHENIRLFMCCLPNELFRRQCEMVGSRDDKDNDVDLFLAGKYSGGLDRIRIQSRGVNQGDIHHTVVQ